jgi:hypothetical protein
MMFGEWETFLAEKICIKTDAKDIVGRSISLTISHHRGGTSEVRGSREFLLSKK